jgi:hypothetical protein
MCIRFVEEMGGIWEMSLSRAAVVSNRVTKYVLAMLPRYGSKEEE